jgi:outer membrane protein OmpA-like peptidoglycan-associated protein
LRDAGIQPGATILVGGFASKDGSKAANQALSVKRANAIAKEIKAILPNVKVSATGYGSTVNKACTKFQNRCVVISVKQPIKG